MISIYPMQQTPIKYTKEKIIIVIIVGLSSACVMGLGLYIPQIYTSIVRHMYPHYSNDDIDAKASTYKSFMDGSNAILGLFLSPIFGGLADVYGRKRIMVVGAISMVVSIGMLELAYLFNLLWMTYVSCFFSLSMVFQICGMAFMSDISEDETEKSNNFGLVFAAYMLGIIFGSFVLGLLGKFGITVGLISLATITVVMTVFLALAFNENTLLFKKGSKKPFHFSNINPFSSIRLILGMDGQVTTLALIYAINFVAISDSMTSGFLYGWGTGIYPIFTFILSLSFLNINISFIVIIILIINTNGLGAVVGGVSSMICQVIGVRLLLKVVNRPNLLAITMYFAVIVHCVQGYAPLGWIYMVGIVASGFVAIGFPLLQSLISERIPKEQQGIAFGGISGIGSIAAFVGALFTENIFSWCLENKNFITCPGTAFYICGFLFFVDGSICLMLVLIKKQGEMQERSNINNNNINNSTSDIKFRDSHIYGINNESQPLIHNKR